VLKTVDPEARHSLLNLAVQWRELAIKMDRLNNDASLQLCDATRAGKTGSFAALRRRFAFPNFKSWQIICITAC